MVSTTSPINMSTGVAFNSKITATFSETMNSSTITTASFTLMQGTSFVSGTVTYSGTTATFTPSSNLTPNTFYTATITTTAKNVYGSRVANNYVWIFTTGAAAATCNKASCSLILAASRCFIARSLCSRSSLGMPIATVENICTKRRYAS